MYTTGTGTSCCTVSVRHKMEVAEGPAGQEAPIALQLSV